LAVGNVMDNEGSLFTVALLPGLIFVGMGGLTIFTRPASGRRSTGLTDTGPRPALFTPTTADHNTASITTGRTP